MLIGIKRQSESQRNEILLHQAGQQKRISITGRQLANKQIAKNNSWQWEKFQLRNKRVEILMKWNVVCQQLCVAAFLKSRSTGTGVPRLRVPCSVFLDSALLNICTARRCQLRANFDSLCSWSESLRSGGGSQPRLALHFVHCLRRFVYYWLGTANRFTIRLMECLVNTCGQTVISFS